MNNNVFYEVNLSPLLMCNIFSISNLKKLWDVPREKEIQFFLYPFLFILFSKFFSIYQSFDLETVWLFFRSKTRNNSRPKNKPATTQQ